MTCAQVLVQMGSRCATCRAPVTDVKLYVDIMVASLDGVWKNHFH